MQSAREALADLDQDQLVSAVAMTQLLRLVCSDFPLEVAEEACRLCGSSQGTTRGVPVLQGQEVAFLSAKGDRTVANGSFWGAHRLVYAVVPQSSGATWSGSSGDFEAEAAAAIVAKKYSYDLGAGTPRLGDVKATAERDGRPRPALEGIR